MTYASIPALASALTSQTWIVTRSMNQINSFLPQVAFEKNILSRKRKKKKQTRLEIGTKTVDCGCEGPSHVVLLGNWKGLKHGARKAVQYSELSGY